jgi:membrane associated rhomboid family serine protease
VVLIVANLLVATLDLFGQRPLDDLAFSTQRPTVLTAFSSLFLHRNLPHLLGNMIFLAAVGPLIEFGRGSWRFGLVYVVCGLAGVLGHWLVMGRLPGAELLMGASGAIAGCVAFCTLLYLRAKVPLFPNFGVPVAAISFVWLALQIAGGFFRLGETTAGGSAFWAHIAGFIAGLLLTLALGVTKDQTMIFGHEVLDRMNERGPAALLAAAEAHLARHPNDLKALAQKANALADMDRLKEAAEVSHLFLKVAPLERKGEGVRLLAHSEGLGEMYSTARMKLAHELAESDAEAAEKLIESVATGPEDPEKPEALLEWAELLKEKNPAQSQSALDELQRIYSLHPVTDRARAKGLLP